MAVTYSMRGESSVMLSEKMNDNMITCKVKKRRHTGKEVNKKDDEDDEEQN